MFEEPLHFLCNEMVACGLTVMRLDTSGFSTSNDTLAALVHAAHGKGYAAPELIALRDYLGAASVEWLAYKALRLDRLDDQRGALLPAKQIFRFLRLWYNAAYTENPVGSGYYVVRPKKAAWDQFRVLMASIVAQLPDEE